MKHRRLALLIIDDSDDDALFLVEDLKEAGYDPHFSRVATSKELEGALTTGCWDLVVCDYRMPGFGGEAAVALVKKLNPGLPFVFVSGTLPPESKVLFEKADGFVSKGDSGQLIQVVERVLERAGTTERQRGTSSRKPGEPGESQRR